MINIENLSVKLGNFSLNDINLHIDSGDFFALLGPSGSGKTMLLESIAGLKPLKKGRVILNKEDITDKKPEERNVSICYQNFALFPHMKIKDNIRYGLRFRKDGKQLKYKENFDMLVEFLKIDHILNRYPTFLSGGEKQRAALARALIVDPDILLLDEPLSALDANIKESIELELKNLHQNLRTTTIMVTHNFREAYSLANRVGIIKDGSIIQSGQVQEVFQKPKTAIVAQFVGMKNIFKVQDDMKNIKTDFPNANYIGIRPENIIINNEEIHCKYCFKGVIRSIKNCGLYREVDIASHNHSYQSYLTPNMYDLLNLHEGKEVYFGFDSKYISIIPDIDFKEV